MTLTPRRVPLDFLAASVGGEILERRSRIRGARRRGLLSPQVIETRHRYMTGARGDGETAVSDVVFDTRRVLAGALFCCVPGQRVDGHDLAGEALRAGAAALLVQRPLELDAPQLLVGSVRAALAPLADAFYESPSRRMDLVGVTGTNGKTTTTFMLEAIFRAAKLVPGVNGTVEVRFGSRSLPVAHTTPEAPDLQRLLAEMADSGVQAAAMEVSSHGLALGRVDATRFRAAVFTNLTQDHLDFHRDLEDYYHAKRRLLTPAFTGVGIVNTDDPFGRRLAVEAAGAGIEVVTTGTARGAAWRAVDLEAALDGTRFRVEARPARASYASNWPGSSTWPTRSARWRPPRRSASTWTPRPPGWRAWRACPGVSSASTRDNRSPCWSTTRTRPTRWRTSCGRPGP